MDPTLKAPSVQGPRKRSPGPTRQELFVAYCRFRQGGYAVILRRRCDPFISPGNPGPRDHVIGADQDAVFIHGPRGPGFRRDWWLTRTEGKQSLEDPGRSWLRGGGRLDW